MAGVVHLWVREDGEEPKALGAGVIPPGPGKVVAVRARSAGEARLTLSARRVLVGALGREPTKAEIELLRAAGAIERAELLEAVSDVDPATLTRDFGSAS